MSERDHLSWRPLPAAPPGIPSLLVASAFTGQSYTVHVTDLAHVWGESLDKKQIYLRALHEDTSIDPTDGPDQMKKLLDLLRAALDAGAPAHNDTTLALAAGGDGDDHDSLVLDITCTLPKPLRPLKWPMRLQRYPPSALSTGLVLPLVRAQYARVRETDALVAALRDKDVVIAKLADKLEATGVPLENVFTSLSGRRKVTRAVAEDRVRGLAPFVESEFRKKQKFDEADPTRMSGGLDDTAGLLGSVFGGADGMVCEPGTALDTGSAPRLDDWWTMLGKGKALTLVERGKDRHDNSSLAKSPPVQRESEPKATDDNDDFQVQATPPGRSQSRASKKRAVPDTNDDETSDGEDASEPDIPDSLPIAHRAEDTTPSKPSPPKPSRSRLGVIGGPSRQAAAEEAQPPPQSPARPKPVADEGSDTASGTDDEDEEDMDASPHARSPPPKPVTPPRKRVGGIGHIGGRPKATTSSAAAADRSGQPSSSSTATADEHGNEENEENEDNEDNEDNEKVAPSPAVRSRHKLGAIGGRKPPPSTALRETDDERQRSTRASSTVDDHDHDHDEERGRTRSPGPKEANKGGGEGKQPSARETSEERATRRRAELRQYLNSKTAAKGATGPVKKRRKF